MNAAKLGRAFGINLLLPGAGQIYLGQWRLGLTLLGGFLATFAGTIAVFLLGMAKYYSALTGSLHGASMDITAGSIFNLPWLIGLATISILHFLISLGLLFIIKPASIPECPSI